MIKRLNSDVFVRLQAQAEEAKKLGLIKLAEHVEANLPPETWVRDDSEKSITRENLEEQVEASLWHAATSIIDCYNLKHADIVKVNDAIKYLTANFITELKGTLEIDDFANPDEGPLPGEVK